MAMKRKKERNEVSSQHKINLLEGKTRWKFETRKQQKKKKINGQNVQTSLIVNYSHIFLHLADYHSAYYVFVYTFCMSLHFSSARYGTKTNKNSGSSKEKTQKL